MPFIEFYILGAAAFLLLEGLYSGMETGIYVLDPLQYQVRLKGGDRGATTLERLLGRKQQMVTSLLVGTNLCIFAATVYATRVTRLLYPGHAEAAVALITTAFTTPAVLIFAEMLPKNIYRSRSEVLVYSSARALYISSLVFSPFVKVLSVLTAAVNFLLGSRGTFENEFLTRASVEHHLTGESRPGPMTPSQLEMARNIMQLSRKDLSHAMIPLRDTVLVSESAAREEVLELVRRRRYSRMPVYRQKRSDIIGVLNVFDLFYQDQARPVKDLVRPLPRVSRSARIDEALLTLRSARMPMGLVVGPREEPLGIVTIKDLLEEVTGEIRAW